MYASAALAPFLRPRSIGTVHDLPKSGGQVPELVARDEAYWLQVQHAFSVDRSLIHLNNGGVCPPPVAVQRALHEHQQYACKVPFYVHRRILSPQVERVRQGIAEVFGCDREEVALTRNTSEGMEICQLGLTLEPGAEILTTDQDYPRMINTWRQRIRREGMMLKQISIPVPAEDQSVIVNRFREAITDRTRAIMICHMIDLTGHVMPVKDIVDLGRQHGVPVLVDGAQGFGQLDFTQEALGCDYYATSLHKWLMGPPGTGFLFVRKDHIGDLWPLMPSGIEMKHDIRKFEDVGTQPLSHTLAISEALAFHSAIGVQNKLARLRYLRDYWLSEVRLLDRVRVKTAAQHAAGLATIEIDGIDSRALRDYLWQHHRIIVRPIKHPAVEGIRVSPGLYTTLHELDQFIEVMRHVIRDGVG